MLVGKVQIAGGGIAGLSAAAALRARDVEVEVHEKFDALQGRATGFSVWSYAIKRLMEWGFDRDALDAIGREIVETHIVDDRDRELMVLPIGDASGEAGAPSMDVHRRRLQEMLIERIGAERYHFGSEVTGVERDGEAVKLLLADGSGAAGDLVLGGDGIHSVVRDEALKQKVDLKTSRYKVIEGIAKLDSGPLPKGHHKQVWGSKARSGVGWISDTEVRWFLGGRGIAMVDDPSPTKAEILERVAEMPEIVGETVDATPEEQIVQTEVRHAYPPKFWHDGRVVLLGDSAHTLSPFAGMGACSTIEDVGHLVRLLDESPDVPTALASFQAEREGEVAEIEKTGRHNERMMMPSNPILYWARNEVLGHAPDEKLMEIAEDMTTSES